MQIILWIPTKGGMTILITGSLDPGTYGIASLCSKMVAGSRTTGTGSAKLVRCSLDGR